jgi:hypothetical protein
MVISHKHRYVFVQTMKTASTAIATELCENYAGEMILHKHASYAEYLAQANPDKKRYFSFAGVRNPLDVAVSRYELRKSESGQQRDLKHRAQSEFAHRPGVGFCEFFVEFMINREMDIATVPLDWHSKTFQSIDYIYQYENLQEEFSTILERAGIAQERLLPTLNDTKKKVQYLQYYDEATLRLAYSHCSDYLRKWGYHIPQGLSQQPPRQARAKPSFRYRLSSQYGETALWAMLRNLRQKIK